MAQENWRNSVIASEESLQALDLTEKSQQESIDVVFRNVFLQISFFVSFSNGIAVLFSRGAKLPCGWFSMIVPLTIAFLVGVTAPIAFGYYRLRSFCHQFAKTVEQRNRMKATATDLLRTRDELADDSENFRDLMEEVAETVEKLEEVKDSPQHLRFQHTMYRRILELIAIGVVFYSILFLIVAYSLFCGGGGNKSFIQVEMGGCNASITALTIELFKYNLSVVSERLGCTISFPGCGNTEIEEKVKIIFLPTEKPMMLEVCTPLNSTLPLQVEMGGYEAPVAAFEKPLLLEAYAPLIATLPLEVQAKMGDLINCILSELNLNSSHFWNSPESN